MEALKAAGRANGALCEPSSPVTEDASTGTKECEDSEATESDVEQTGINTDDNSVHLQEVDPVDTNKVDDSTHVPEPQPKVRLQMPECPPKTFNRSKNISKGTLQLFSPCGAKIGSFEMIKSESMTMLFSTLSRIMPIMAPVLIKLREVRGMNSKNVKVWNAATKKKGAISSISMSRVLYTLSHHNGEYHVRLSAQKGVECTTLRCIQLS